MTIDITLAIAIISCLVAAVGWLDSRKKIAMKDGARDQVIETLKRDLEMAFNRLRELGERYDGSHTLLVEIKTNLDNLSKQVDRLGERIETHMDESRE